MIFVVVGTQKFQLNRLLKVFDTLLEEEKIDQEVFAQIGNSDYIPKNYDRHCTPLCGQWYCLPFHLYL